MAALPTLYPHIDNGAGIFVTYTGSPTGNMYTLIDEGIAGAVDTNDYIEGTGGTASSASTDYYYCAFPSMPSDFLDGAMLTLNVQARYAQAGRSDDTVGLTFAVVSGAKVLWTSVVAVTPITSTAFANTAVTDLVLNSTGLAASKAGWNNALIRIGQTYSVSMSNDGAQALVSAVELTGTYQLSPPARGVQRSVVMQRASVW